MSGFADFLVNHHLPQIVTSTCVADSGDLFASNITTDIYNGSAWEGSVFVVQKCEGTTGTATVTCNSCDDTDPTTATAITFMYRYSTTQDVFTEWATSASVTITAGANETWEFAIAHSDLYKGTATAPVNDEYVRWVATEVDSTAVGGSAFCMLIGPKSGHEIPGTVLT